MSRPMLVAMALGRRASGYEPMTIHAVEHSSSKSAARGRGAERVRRTAMRTERAEHPLERDPRGQRPALQAARRPT